MSGKNEIVFRIITIGDSNVGKTSIIRRYTENIFEESILSTIGVSFSIKNVKLKNNIIVQLKLIDTAGQERHRALSRTYFKNTEGVLFIFSFEEKESFDNLREWIRLFKESYNGKEGIPTFLIGNKNDLEKNVTQEEINEFLKDYKDMKFEETSAKNNTSIDKVFEEMAELLYKDYVKTGGDNKKQNTTKLKADNNNENKKKNGCICTRDADI